MFQQTINPPNIDRNDKVIVFDGVCKLCNSCVQFIIRHDKQHKIKLCATQSNAGNYLLERHQISINEPETILYVKNDQYFFKSEAVLELMTDIGYRLWLVRIFRRLPLILRDWLYDTVARNRYRFFGKYDRCRLPQSDHHHRYLW